MPATLNPKPNVAAVFGFDFGLRHIGVAVGNTLTQSGQPLATITAEKGVPDWGALNDLILAWQPHALVVGQPHHADGTKHPLTDAIERFVAGLQTRFGLPVYTIDERLSSTEAHRRLKASAPNQRAKRVVKSDIDSLAAAIILETWLTARDGN